MVRFNGSGQHSPHANAVAAHQDVVLLTVFIGVPGAHFRRVNISELEDVPQFDSAPGYEFPLAVWRRVAFFSFSNVTQNVGLEVAFKVDVAKVEPFSIRPGEIVRAQRDRVVDDAPDAFQPNR